MPFKNEKIKKTSTRIETQSRRTFLKKAVYVTPTIVALGALTKPTKSEAGFNGPPSGPVWS